MAKTLVLAEKPSVGRELARVLGCKKSGNGYLEGEKYIVTWALGHLVTLADPDVYDKKYEKWDMQDLPMLPQNMKLVVIPESRAAVSGSFLADEAGRCDGTGDCHGRRTGRRTGSPVDHDEGGLEGEDPAALDLVPDG